MVVEFAVEIGTPPAGWDVTNEAHLGDGLGHHVILKANSTYNPGYGLLINDGALTTNSPTVTLQYQWKADDGVTHVQFSNDRGFGPEGNTTAWLPVNAADPTHPGRIEPATCRSIPALRARRVARYTCPWSGATILDRLRDGGLELRYRGDRQ